MTALRLLRSAPLLATFFAAASIGCAHAPPASTAAEGAERPAQPQLSTKSDKPSAALPADQASGQAQLDAALAQLQGVSVFFQFDEAALTLDAEGKLAVVGEVLRKHPQLSVRVEGNCDERGSEAYNLALGQRRAEQAKNYLVRMGALPLQVAAVSYGAERPKATGHEEQSWSQNRRDDLVSARPPAAAAR